MDTNDRPVLTLAALLADLAEPQPDARFVPAYTVPSLYTVMMRVIKTADPALPYVEQCDWRNDLHDAIETAAGMPLPQFLKSKTTEELRATILAAADQALEDFR